jgi:hypothetical protein
MQLTYTDPDETVIKAILDEGENLDDIIGPREVFIPNDPLNRHYAEILDRGLKVDAYEAPQTDKS